MTKEELKKEAEEKCVCTDEAMRIMYGIGYIDGAEPREKRIEELENANEWHYVKDGDLPKDYGYYLVALKSVAYKGFVCEVVYFTGCIFTKEGEISDNVYAWKEIVLPELKESE